MKIVGKILQILGAIFLLIILVIVGCVIYFVVADPFNIKPLLIDKDEPENTSEESTDKNPLLTAEQEQQLEALGIDPAELPQEITPAMEQCFIDELGEDKVKFFASGAASPSPLDVIKTRHCLDL